jgi:hypothetical protein
MVSNFKTAAANSLAQNIPWSVNMQVTKKFPAQTRKIFAVFTKAWHSILSWPSLYLQN